MDWRGFEVADLFGRGPTLLDREAFTLGGSPHHGAMLIRHRPVLSGTMTWLTSRSYRHEEFYRHHQFNRIAGYIVRGLGQWLSAFGKRDGLAIQ